MKKDFIQIIQNIEQLDLIKKGRVLDLGCRDGVMDKYLARKGYIVDAVDRAPVLRSSKNISVIAADIADIKIYPNTYSFIICRHTLPFIENKKTVKKIIIDMSKSLTKGGVLFFTLFGPQDEFKSWNKKMSFFTFKEASKIVDDLPLKIYEKSNLLGYQKSTKGILKYSEIHQFICIKE